MPLRMRLQSEKTNPAKFAIRHSDFVIFLPPRVLAHPGHFVPYFTIFPGPAGGVKKVAAWPNFSMKF